MNVEPPGDGGTYVAKRHVPACRLRRLQRTRRKESAIFVGGIARQNCGDPRRTLKRSIFGRNGYVEHCVEKTREKDPIRIGILSDAMQDGLVERFAPV